MKFTIIYKVGQSIRDANILAKDLEEAEVVANQKYKNWTEIKITNFKGEKHG